MCPHPRSGWQVWRKSHPAQWSVFTVCKQDIIYEISLSCGRSYVVKWGDVWIPGWRSTAISCKSRNLTVNCSRCSCTTSFYTTVRPHYFKLSILKLLHNSNWLRGAVRASYIPVEVNTSLIPATASVLCLKGTVAVKISFIIFLPNLTKFGRYM